MILKSKTGDFIAFGCKLTDTTIKDYIIQAGMVYFGRGISKKLKLYTTDGELVGKYNIPKELTGALIHGYCSAASFTKVVDS